jgi:hypothetical protein
MFCIKTGKPAQATRLIYDGVRVNENETVEDLELQDGDVLEAFVLQEGGF